ncbi:MAG: ABC transporter substrate-binding protein [Armatimonadetes bacterium]|nr:ABC transporter substrate-binding protein [Armatimonadota bacterium]
MPEWRTQAEVVVAVDDTDIPGEGGTGSVARAIAARLSPDFRVWGVTRHQFAVLPEIPLTARNSGNVIHLLDAPDDLHALAHEVVDWVRGLHVAGSEPGVCVARAEALLGVPLGLEAKGRFVHRSEAWDAAAAAGAVLRHAVEAEDGIVGAFAGACLAAQGNDGRFVEMGRLRELAGEVTVKEVLEAGGDEVRSVEEDLLTDEVLLADKLRPALRYGKCVLYCKREKARWVPIHGAPGDREEEARLHAR